MSAKTLDFDTSKTCIRPRISFIRNPEEIAQARDDWEERQRFGEVPGEHGHRLPAPKLVRFARPNPAS